MNSTNPVNNTTDAAVPSASATTNSGTGAGSSFGNRVRGVFEVVHGVGDNIRGTALGAVDTMGHNGLTKNDEIARQGRLETQRGMAHLKEPPLGTQPGEQGLPGSTGPATYSHDATRETGIGSYPNDPTGNPPMGNTGNRGYGDGAHHQVPGADTTQGTGPYANSSYPAQSSNGAEGYPSHHRDDAISGVPPSQLDEVQGAAHSQGPSLRTRRAL
ncbi:hypothetical protein BDQ17DRAFT_745382 [Cyathus striatus]|nr:hypothetical protein BDQ17DRAFT_745382 [Cyathus striatus]